MLTCFRTPSTSFTALATIDAMHGPIAFLPAIGFIGVAVILLVAIAKEWESPSRESTYLRRAGLTLFVLLWAAAMCLTIYTRARFLYQLHSLKPEEIDSIEIGKHTFADRETVKSVVGALRKSEWFEANHGGWGDSIHLTLRKHSGDEVVLDLALYFRERAAIVRPAPRPGTSYVVTDAISIPLLEVLEQVGVRLPDCDTGHGRPCTAEQLNL